MPEKLKAIRRLRQRFGDTVLITGSIGAPFSACGLTWGLEQAMMVMLDDPALLHEGMEYWLEFYKRYIKAQQKAGAHAIWLGDCNAFSGLLSVDQYNQHVLSQTRELVRYAEEELDIIIWMHNSEVKLPHVLSHLPLGVSIENIGPGGDMREIRESTRGRQAISGNLDPLEVLWKGTPESIAKDVERIMDICAPGGGFALCTGEMNPRATPEENMHAYIDAARRFSP
jgi:uroporphyrinogen-III decarboxylase